MLLMVRELGAGGCERDLAKIARGLDRARFAPHVGCFRRGFREAELAAASVPVVEFPVRSFVSSSAAAGAWAMVRYLRRHAIGLVHCFDLPTDLFGIPVARACGVPAVVASRLWLAELIPSPREAHLLRMVERMADAVVVNSGAVRRELVERERLARGQVVLSHNGVDTGVFHPGCGARPAALENAGLVVGTACVLRPEKDVAALVTAFSRAFGGQPAARLAIVGDGPLRGELEALGEKLGIVHQCVFAGMQSEVAPWLRAMDIFVLPSLSESFPNALLEAMACGCAVVASRVGGTPELVTDGEDGLLFEAGDVAGLAAGLARLAGDAELRRRLGSAAARRAREEFSIGRAVARLETLYAALMDGATASRQPTG